MKELEFHPYANLFPLIEGQAFEDLVADVRKNGIREAIVLFEGKILDGRNRFRAGRAAGLLDEQGLEIETGILSYRVFIPKFDGDPLAFVISANLHRRHLDEGQRAMVAARLAKGSHGGVRLKQDANLQLDPAPAPAAPAMTIAAAAKALNVSPRSVASARAVAEQGAPELVAAVDAGTVAVSAAETLAHLPKEEQTRLIKTASPAALYGVIKAQKDALTAQKKVKRAEREKVLGAKQKALPAKKYGVIYADPAWSFASRSRDTGMDRAPDNHYPTMSTAEICALPVQDIAADDCVLFLWGTVPMDEDAHAVMARWGFKYVSAYVWIKEGGAPGLGYWSRVDHENLLIGVRGNPPCPAPGTQRSSEIRAPVGRHSEKPAIVREMIEQYFPTLPKIELNARVASPGWDVWGNEAPEVEPMPEPEPEAPFIVEHAGVRAIVVNAAYGPEIYAVDLNAPFPSATGFHSLIGHRREPGETADAHARRLIDAAIAYNPTGKKGAIRPMRLPERAYRLPVDEKGEPVARERGVWVDRDAPPFGLHLDHLEGLDCVLERWKSEDSAAFSGQKAKRSCPKSLHPNHRIIKISGQMLTPVAEYPTSGAYVVTAFKWIAGERVEGWAYVDEAAFHDDQATPEASGDFPDAPAEGEDIEIPAFLRRERCPDTADMLDGEDAR